MNSVPAAAVLRGMQALSELLGVKGLKVASQVYCIISGINPDDAVETSKLEYGRGGENFRWSSEMHR
jgi:hypothetical protein